MLLISFPRTSASVRLHWSKSHLPDKDVLAFSGASHYQIISWPLSAVVPFAAKLPQNPEKTLQKFFVLKWLG